MTPSHDPWEAYLDVQEYGHMHLSNVEFTTTTLCNMRCEHCAVGYTLQPKDPRPLPLDLLIGRLDDFVDIGFAVMDKKPTYEQRAAYFRRMVENAQALTKEGVIISAETMINKRTLPYLEQIHDQIVEIGCQRYEDIQLLKRLYNEKNVNVRNDPDGRSRLNVNIFDGDIIVTDFGDTPPLGNVKETTLVEAYNKWMNSNIAKEINCHCSAVQCLGPNILVKDTYYPDVDFTKKVTNIT